MDASIDHRTAPQFVAADGVPIEVALTLKEKARQLRVSDCTVRRHALKLGGYKVGKDWRFPYNHLRLALPASELETGDRKCLSKEKIANSCGSLSTAYAKALGLATGQK